MPLVYDGRAVSARLMANMTLTWLVQTCMAISTVEPAVHFAAMVPFANWPPTEKRVSPGKRPPHTPSFELPLLQTG